MLLSKPLAKPRSECWAVGQRGRCPPPRPLPRDWNWLEATFGEAGTQGPGEGTLQSGAGLPVAAMGPPGVGAHSLGQGTRAQSWWAQKPLLCPRAFRTWGRGKTHGKEAWKPATRLLVCSDTETSSESLLPPGQRPHSGNAIAHRPWRLMAAESDLPGGLLSLPGYRP